MVHEQIYVQAELENAVFNFFFIRCQCTETLRLYCTYLFVCLKLLGVINKDKKYGRD